MPDRYDRPSSNESDRPMCYSARVYADWKKFCRILCATMSVHKFYETFWRRNQEQDDDGRDDAADNAEASDQPKWKTIIPTAVEAAFATAQTDQEREVKALIDAYTASVILGLFVLEVCKWPSPFPI